MNLMNWRKWTLRVSRSTPAFLAHTACGILGETIAWQRKCVGEEQQLILTPQRCFLVDVTSGGDVHILSSRRTCGGRSLEHTYGSISSVRQNQTSLVVEIFKAREKKRGGEDTPQPLPLKPNLTVTLAHISDLCRIT